MSRTKPRQPRVAVISLHTSPRDQPGVGDSGGMNVYVLAVAERLAQQGIEVDIFTRCHGSGAPEVEGIAEGSRLIQIKAGPCAPVAKEDLPRFLPEFLGGVLNRADREGQAIGDQIAHRHSPYDVVHSHYWLSGWVGSRTKRIWGVPHVASFHTLGKVKNATLADGDQPEPVTRLAGEQRVVRAADRILAPTTMEADHLVRLYGADPSQIRIIAPGVDRGVFAPWPKDEARRRLGLGDARVILFVGRLQPLKGPDVAIRALAETVARAPQATGDLLLIVVGGPARANGVDEVSRLRALAATVGVADRVRFFPPQPHARLAEFYSAAEALVVPSRSESFGLVALEAQACGTPVIAAAVGGLRAAVVDQETGFLVGSHRPADYADRILTLLSNPLLAASLSRGAVAHAARFSWDATAGEVGDTYRDVAEGRSPAA
jgi:D-inositol-3-phosphate glycosyltransferase